VETRKPGTRTGNLVPLPYPMDLTYYSTRAQLGGHNGPAAQERAAQRALTLLQRLAPRQFLLLSPLIEGHCCKSPKLLDVNFPAVKKSD
jgi:hypothetical protein